MENHKKVNFIVLFLEENEREAAELLEKVPWEEIGNRQTLEDYEIALTGKAFEYMMDLAKFKYTDKETKILTQEIILHAKVYARMSPDHKAILVSHLQENSKFMIAMCGDGAND